MGQQMDLGAQQSSEKLVAYCQQQRKQNVGNQLRLFALKMFKSLNKNAKKRLEAKAKVYLDDCFQDQKRLQDLRAGNSNTDHSSATLGEQIFLDSPVDFEFGADPNKYIDEVQKALSKSEEMTEEFKRFR